MICGLQTEFRPVFPYLCFFIIQSFYFPSLYCGITFTTQSLVLMASLVFWCTQVRVQSDPAGRLVITGQPEQLDNPWGITPFKKVCLWHWLKGLPFWLLQVSLPPVLLFILVYSSFLILCLFLFLCDSLWYFIIYGSQNLVEREDPTIRRGTSKPLQPQPPVSNHLQSTASMPFSSFPLFSFC